MMYRLVRLLSMDTNCGLWTRTTVYNYKQIILGLTNVFDNKIIVNGIRIINYQ